MMICAISDHKLINNKDGYDDRAKELSTPYPLFNTPK